MEIHFRFLNWTKNRSGKLMFDYRIPNSFYRIQMRGFPVAKVIKQRSKCKKGFQFKMIKFWGFVLQRQGTLNPLLLPVDQKGRNHFRKIVSAKYFCFSTFAAKEKQNERNALLQKYLDYTFLPLSTIVITLLLQNGFTQ